MPVYAYAILAVGVLVWFTPFVLAHRNVTSASTVDRRSRWGVLLQLLAYSVLWQGHFWTRPLPAWRAFISILLFVAAAILSWTSSKALGSHLRVDAALGAEHQLVRSGPYGIVRNPIYTSMLCVLSATAAVTSSWPAFLVSLAIFMLGTEIRVRTEEKLLASRFGEEFKTYKQSVPAYLPFL